MYAVYVGKENPGLLWGIREGRLRTAEESRLPFSAARTVFETVTHGQQASKREALTSRIVVDVHLDRSGSMVAKGARGGAPVRI